jgi:hypothetical protein
MSRMNELQLYVAIKACAVRAERLERSGRTRAAAGARRRERQYGQELRERLDFLLASGRRMPDQVGAARGRAAA